MRKFVTFFMMSNTAGAVKRATISKNFFSVLICLLFAGLGVAGYGVYDYARLQAKISAMHHLENRIRNQSGIIVEQRGEIGTFAEEINSLKRKLVELDHLKNRIRTIADLGDIVDGDTLLNVGGSMPEDLKPTAALKQKEDRAFYQNMRSQVAQLNQASSNLTQSYEALLKGILEKKSLLAATPTLIPADGWYSSRFGYRRSPFTKRREFHKGLDIAARKGTPIVAPADGRVIRIGRNGSLGLMMVIDHGHGFVTRYGHIQNALKSVGDFVKRGDQIARVGDSGRTTGPHLHYEVIVNNRNENPENYILN